MKQWRMILALFGLGLGVGVGVYVGAQDGPGPDPGPGSGSPAGSSFATQYNAGGGLFGGAGPGSAGEVLTSNGAMAPSFQAAPGGTPGGASTNVQFNNAGAFDGDAALSWDGTKLSIGTPDVMVVNGATITSLFALNSDAATIYEAHTHQGAGSLGPIYYGARSRGTEAAPTIVADTDALASLYGIGYDGTDYSTSALIQFVVNGTPGNNDMPGAIDFYTSPDGSQTLARHLRIDQGGAFNVGVDGVGTAGQVLSSGGAGVPPTWETVSGGVTQTTGNFTATYTDGFTINVTQVINYVLTGSTVTLRFTAAASGTSDSTAFTTAAGDIPVSLRPTGNINGFGFQATDNSVQINACVRVNADGSLGWYAIPVVGGTCQQLGWTAAGTKTLPVSVNQNVFTYSLN